MVILPAGSGGKFQIRREFEALTVCQMFVRIESWLEHLAPVRSWGILPQEFTYTHGPLAKGLYK